MSGIYTLKAGKEGSRRGYRRWPERPKEPSLPVDSSMVARTWAKMKTSNVAEVGLPSNSETRLR